MAWLYTEFYPFRRPASAFLTLVALLALVLNATEMTPLMDGLKDHFELSARLWLYAPTLIAAALLVRYDDRHTVRPS